MRKAVLKSSILAGILALLAVLPWFRAVKSVQLVDVTKPYLGRYECTMANLGEKDLLEKYAYIDLELETEKEFTLYYREKEGKVRQTHGRYKYDKEKGAIHVTGLKGLFLNRPFPWENGVLTIALPLRGKNLIMRFEQL